MERVLATQEELLDEIIVAHVNRGEEWGKALW